MEFLENIPLAPYTTFQIGGPARWFAEAAHESEIVEAVQFARDSHLPLSILGGGSNLLVSDAGFPGLVLHIRLRGIKDSFHGDNLLLHAAAGESWDEFVSYAVSLDCAGVECLAGIPGTVGGTPIQNVGAYGQEVSGTIQSVRALDTVSGTFVEMTAEECRFGYRQSLFNTTARGRYIVSRVGYSLLPSGPATLNYADLRRYFQDSTEPPQLARVAEAVRAIRREKGMFLVKGDPNCASAGSFFKNPVVDGSTLAAIEATLPPGTTIPRYPAANGMTKLAAAWLLEKAGFVKGYGDGRAGISTQHTLALVNRGGATADEILALSEHIVTAVEAKFGVRLEPEPTYLG